MKGIRRTVALTLTVSFIAAFMLLRQNVAAQSPQVTPASSKTDKPISSTAKLPIPDVLSWELALAESTYASAKNKKNKERLLNIYEKVTGTICMPNLHRVLDYKGNPTFPACLEFIDKTLALDSGNPVAICARSGIEDPICRAAFADQRYLTYSPSTEEKLGIAPLDQVLESRRDRDAIAKQEMQLNRSIQDLQRVHPSKKTPNDKTKLRNAVNQLVQVKCKGSRITLDETDEEIKGPQQKSNFPSDELSEDEILLRAIQAKENDSQRIDPVKNSPLLQSLEKDFGTASGAKAPLSKRIYQVVNDCQRIIEFAQKTDNTASAAQCFRYGYYSPQCIDAKRIEKKLLETEEAAAGKSGTKQKSPGGIDSF